jgi:hypothetical protein
MAMQMPRFLISIDKLVLRQPPWATVLVCVVLIAGVGTIDYKVGPPIVFGPLYLAPIAIAAWYSGRFFSIVIALASATITELDRDFTVAVLPNPRVLAWNAAMRVIFYLAFALLVRIVRLYVRMGTFPE